MGMHMHIIIMERDCIRRILLLIIGIESYYNADCSLCQPVYLTGCLTQRIIAPMHIKKTGD